MIDCLALIGFVCLTRASTIEFGPESTVGRFATARIEGAEMVVTLGTDSLARLDPRRMARACGALGCLRYYKRCESQPSRVSCEYSLASRPFLPLLALRAESSAAYAQAERTIFLLARPDDVESAIPLIAFSQTSDEPPPFKDEAD